MRAAVSFRNRHITDRHIGAVVVRYGSGRLVVGEVNTATAGDEVVQVHKESLIEFDSRVATDYDADGCAGLAGSDRQRAAGCRVVATRSRRVVSGRVIDGDVGVDRL